jgi:tight adherence protein B
VIAASFWSTPAAQVVLAALVGGAVFALGWLLLGTASRAKKDREIAARMAAVTGAGGLSHPVAQQPEGSQGWIPDRVTKFGKRFADSRGFSERLDAELESAGVKVRSGEFVVLSVVAFVVGAVLAAALLKIGLLALVVGAACGMGPTTALRMSLRKRTEKMREQLPDVLTIMASSLRAGHSFMQALDTTAREIAQPAATEFQRVVSEIRLGRPTDDALEALVSDTLRERAMMRRQIQVLTAEGRLSAWVLTGLPIAIGVYMYAVNPDYIGLLFTTKLGLFMLGTAVILLVLGIFWMRKIVDIDV